MWSMHWKEWVERLFNSNFMDDVYMLFILFQIVVTKKDVMGEIELKKDI